MDVGKPPKYEVILKDYNIIDAIELSENTVTKDTINLLYSQIKKNSFSNIY